MIEIYDDKKEKRQSVEASVGFNLNKLHSDDAVTGCDFFLHGYSDNESDAKNNLLVFLLLAKAELNKQMDLAIMELEK